MVKQLQAQYFRYMNHVLKNIAATRYTIKNEELPGPEYKPVPKHMQKEALDFFDQELFTTPHWLINNVIMGLVNLPTEPNFVEDTQVKVLNSLMDVTRINQLLAQDAQFGKMAYPAAEYLAQIHRDIWRELSASGAVEIDNYRRNLQKSYLQNVILILSSKDEGSTETDASSLIKADLFLLKGEIKRAIPHVKNTMTMYHLKDLNNRIKQFETAKTT